MMYRRYNPKELEKLIKDIEQEKANKQISEWIAVKELRKARGISELGPDDTIYTQKEIDEQILKRKTKHQS